MLAPHRVSSLLQAADFSLLPPVSLPDPTPPRDGWKQRHSSESPGQECRMNDPGAPADECVLPDCLRWPAVAIRMSSSEDETRRLALSCQPALLAVTRCSAGFCSAPSLCGRRRFHPGNLCCPDAKELPHPRIFVGGE